MILDLAILKELGYLSELPFTVDDFNRSHLNTMMQYGKFALRELRDQISHLLDQKNDQLQSNKNHCSLVFDRQTNAKLHLPIEIGDYTDFYSKRTNAYNVGCMFRDPKNALLPNWKHIPGRLPRKIIFYCSVWAPIHRPKGQQKPDDQPNPIFGPCKLLDFELELGFYI